MPADITLSEAMSECSSDINKWRFGESTELMDELTRYLNAPLLTLGTKEANDVFNDIEWWKEICKSLRS